MPSASLLKKITKKTHTLKTFQDLADYHGYLFVFSPGALRRIVEGADSGLGFPLCLTGLNLGKHGHA